MFPYSAPKNMANLTRILGVKPADKFRFSFREIKRRAVRLCNRRYEVTHEADDLREKRSTEE